MSWRGVAEALRTLGYRRVATPAANAWDVAPPYYGALADRVAGELDGEPWLLLGHSGAGGLLPAIAERLRGGARAIVFVDAVLPHPGKTWFETAPPALGEMLRDRANDGSAPSWPDWFPPGVLESLLPDAAARAAFAAEARAIPMAYLAESAPATLIAPSTPCGYLQLSTGYETEADAAAAAGWTVAREPLHHLAVIADPERVAAVLHRLIEALSVPFAKAGS
jgi:pimeloyl-ACP methyl ester carboxylesterase